MLADHPALDLVGTVAERTSTRVEHLTTPDRLADWLVAAGLLDTAPAATAADLAAARRLREALYALLRATSNGLPLPPDALAVVHGAAAGPVTTLTLDAAGGLHRDGDVTTALTAVARAAVELVGGPDRHLLRWCANDACTHPFLDRSRGGRRRWCGMAGCGDRAKARAYRARRRGGITDRAERS
jgi:predicted RNA-binding Zn ribbon-like protein